MLEDIVTYQNELDKACEINLIIINLIRNAYMEMGISMIKTFENIKYLIHDNCKCNVDFGDNDLNKLMEYFKNNIKNKEVKNTYELEYTIKGINYIFEVKVEYNNLNIDIFTPRIDILTKVNEEQFNRKKYNELNFEIGNVFIKQMLNIEDLNDVDRVVNYIISTIKDYSEDDSLSDRNYWELVSDIGMMFDIKVNFVTTNRDEDEMLNINEESLRSVYEFIKDDNGIFYIECILTINDFKYLLNIDIIKNEDNKDVEFKARLSFI